MSDLYGLFTDLNCGKVSFSSSVIINDGEIPFDYCVDGDVNNDCFIMKAENGGFRDEIIFNRVENGYTVARKITNVGGENVKVKELKTVFDGITFGGKRKNNYFYSVENPRIYGVFTFPVDYVRTADDASNSDYDVVANNRWADPGVVNERINYSPYQPFPAILLSNYKSKKGFVCGTLSQKVFFHNYLTKTTNNGVELTMFSSFKGIAYRIFEAGETLNDEWYIGITREADNLDKLFCGYAEQLRKKLPINYGATDINRDNLVWGSWNDGIFRDVSHDMLLNEAKAVAKYFPSVKWFQLDDGYALYNKTENSSIAHGLGVPYENDGIDYEKFPRGLKGFTDELRKTGLKPAVWIGGMAPKNSKIYKERPEWYADYSVRMKETAIPDVSVKEMRNYMESALDKFILDYGFDGVKHDFWSYPFEASDDLLKNKERSGYEYRAWWCSEIRKRLPSDGYFQTGCDLVLANPFLGEYFTNYRYGIDVASGNRDYIKTSIFWGTACFATHTGDLFVPNSDAVGLLPDLCFSDFLLWVNYVLITHSMVELSGRYYSGDFDKKRFNILRKATCNINNGQDVYLCNFDYRKSGTVMPEILYNDTPFFSTDKGGDVLPIRTVALFNLSDEDKTVRLSFNDLNLKDGEYIVTDVWNETTDIYRSGTTYNLRPYESRLLSINVKRKYSVLDSDVKFFGAQRRGKRVDAMVENVGTAKIKTTDELKTIRLNGKIVMFNKVNDYYQFDICEKGKLSLLFN